MAACTATTESNNPRNIPVNPESDILPRMKRLTVAVYGCLGALSLCAGCTPHYDLKDPDPASKIPAMKREAQRGDKRDLALLVNDLESDDPAVRLYAIQTLEHLTGSRLGYDYYADDASREQAVARWRDWLAAQGITSTRPSTSAAK